MQPDRIADVLVAHSYARMFWHPKGDTSGVGKWTCRCGATGDPVGRNIAEGFRMHQAREICVVLDASEAAL